MTSTYAHVQLVIQVQSLIIKKIFHKFHNLHLPKNELVEYEQVRQTLWYDPNTTHWKWI